MTGQLRQGEVIADRFVLQRLLGEGGMGAVWAATHRITRKEVALKFLKPRSGDDSQLQRRFLREARAASAVRHPNVVQVHDIVELPDGSPVMVMDLLEGESLAARLTRCGRLTLHEVVDLLVPVISAVGTAHAAGIVHRDLKPDNIFLERGPDGTVIPKVLDFGIAKISEPDGEVPVSSKLTQTGAMMGTPYYMAPEQAFGERDVDHRVDIWALGVILYECLAGRRPIDGENLGQLLRVLTTGDIAPLSLRAPDVPGDVVVLVSRMLSVRKDNRPKDLREVFHVLRSHARVSASSFEGALPPRPSMPNPVPGRSLSMPFADTQVASSHTTSKSAPPTAAHRNRRPVLVGAAMIALTAVVLLGRVLWSGHAAHTTAEQPLPLASISTPGESAATPAPTPSVVPPSAQPQPPESSSSAAASPRRPPKTDARPPSSSATPPPPQPPPTAAKSSLPGGVVPELPF